MVDVAHWMVPLGPNLSPVSLRYFAWQVWHLMRSIFVLCGNYLRFAWQAWHFWHWAASLGPILSPVTRRLFAWQVWHLLISIFILCGAVWHKFSFIFVLCDRWGIFDIGIGVAQIRIHLYFTWQTWDLWHGAAPLGPVLSPDFIVRDAADICVAGTALDKNHLYFTWQVGHNLWCTFFYPPSL